MSISRISNKWVHTITLNRLRQRGVFRNKNNYNWNGCNNLQLDYNLCCDIVDLIDLTVIEEIYKFPGFQVFKFPGFQ